MQRWDDEVDRFERQARDLDNAGEPLEAAVVRNQAGLTALEGGLLARARGLFEQVDATYAAVERLFDRAAAQANLALVLMRTGALRDSADHFLHALASLDASRGGAPVGMPSHDLREANIRVNLGVAYRRLTELDAAADQYRRAQELYQRHGRSADVVDVEANLAVLDERSGRLGEARWRLVWVREQIPPGADDRARARAATTLATIDGQEGRFADAAQLLDEAHATYTALRLPRELAEVITNQGYVLLHRGDLAGARRHLEQAEALFAQMGMHVDRARVLGGLGSLALRLGDVREAVERYAVAMEVYDAAGLHRELAATLVNLGVAHATAEDWASAVQLQEAALEIYADLGPVREDAAQAEHNLGVALAGQGDFPQAARHYRRARSVYRRLGRRREAAEIEVNLGIVAAAAGDREGARRRYRRAARELRDLGLAPALARCVHNLGLTWPPGSTARRQRVLPAWLALDARRFTLVTSAERYQWREVVGQTSAAAFDEARHDPLVLAEIIEHARAIGAPHDADTPPPVPGLVNPASPFRPGPHELPVQSPRPVHCGWPTTLTPYLARARQLRDVDGTTVATTQPDPATSLVAVLLASVHAGEAV